MVVEPVLAAPASVTFVLFVFVHVLRVEIVHESLSSKSMKLKLWGTERPSGRQSVSGTQFGSNPILFESTFRYIEDFRRRFGPCQIPEGLSKSALEHDT